MFMTLLATLNVWLATLPCLYQLTFIYFLKVLCCSTVYKLLLVLFFLITDNAMSRMKEPHLQGHGEQFKITSHKKYHIISIHTWLGKMENLGMSFPGNFAILEGNFDFLDKEIEIAGNLTTFLGNLYFFF